MARTLQVPAGHQQQRSSWTGRFGNHEPVPEDGNGMDQDWEAKTVFAEHQERCQQVVSEQFRDELLDWAEREFDFKEDTVEEGIRYGLSFRNPWVSPLFIMALLVGESMNLTQDEVRRELEKMLAEWKRVRHQSTNHC